MWIPALVQLTTQGLVILMACEAGPQQLHGQSWTSYSTLFDCAKTVLDAKREELLVLTC